MIHQTLFVKPRNDIAGDEIKGEQRQAAPGADGNKYSSSANEITVEKSYHSHDKT
jgi:hypothetical protein